MTRVFAFVLAALFAISLSLASSAQQLTMPRYYAQDIGSLSGPASVTPTAINRLGHVVGYAILNRNEVNGTPLTHAFFWSPETGMQDLGALNDPGNNSAALAINDHDDVVGWSDTGIPYAYRRGFLYRNGAMFELGAFSVPDGIFSSSVATGINNSGLIVGHSQILEAGPAGAYETFRAVRLDPLADLGGLLENPNDYSQALAVNDAGIIVGLSAAVLVPGGTLPHATRFNDLIDLHTAPGDSSIAYAINSAGDTVGQANFILQDGRFVSQAYIQSPNGLMRRLGAIDGQETFSMAEGINASGQVVGKSFFGSFAFNYHGFVWDSQRGMQDLNRLTRAGVADAVAINDNGQIAAVGGDFFSQGGALRLNPIPGGAVTAPDMLKATPTSFTSIELNWRDRSSNEGLFAIEMLGPGMGGFQQIGTVYYDETTFTAENLTPGATYQFRVRALGIDQNSGYSNTAQAATFFTLPSAPFNLTATDFGTGTAHLNWAHDGLNQLSGFVIEQLDIASGNYFPIGFVSQFTRDFYTGINTDSSYTYRVRAINICGFSAPSNSVTLDTDPLDVSSLVTVTRGGFQYKRSNGRFTQIVTVKNITTDRAITVPIRLALENLSGSVTLANKTGITHIGPQSNLPYLSIMPANGTRLEPGESVTVVLEFTNPGSVSITYGTKVLAHGIEFTGGGGGNFN